MTSDPGREPPRDGPVTLINIFEVPAEQVDEFVERWYARARFMAAAPGFRDATLHRAVSPLSRFQLVNVAHWDSQADLAAAQRGDAFQDGIRALREDPRMRFSAYPALYEAAAVLGSHEAGGS
jgi:heme-degrading monooxygenase HmoA